MGSLFKQHKKEEYCVMNTCVYSAIVGVQATWPGLCIVMLQLGVSAWPSTDCSTSNVLIG